MSTTALALEESFHLTAKQLEANKVITSEAMYILLYGGARSTKTFTILRSIVLRAQLAPGSRHAVLRLRFKHVKQSIVFDTFPKMMALCFPDVTYHLDKQDWFAELPNKSQIWFGGLDDKERAEKVLGNEYVTVFLNETSQISYNSFLIIVTRLAQKCMYMCPNRRAKREMRLKLYCDENPPNKGHWTHKLFIEKLEPDSKQPVEDKDDYAFLLMNPKDNVENLPEAYIKTLKRMPKRKRNRFWSGLFGDTSENALWNDEIIEEHRVSEIPENIQLVRVVVPVDPSGASDDEEENNDDIGIGVIALGSDGIAYVLEDLTLHAGPATWGKVAANAYYRHSADRVIGEDNFGGAMVEFVIKTADPNISYKNVHASRGKTVRAEPVSALHETGKIKFVGRFPDLEDELLDFTTTGYTGPRSPNRADWFIWGITELFPGLTEKEKPEPIDVSIPNVKCSWARN